MPVLELNTLHLINVMSGIMQQQMLVEQIRPLVNLIGNNPRPV